MSITIQFKEINKELMKKEEEEEMLEVFSINQEYLGLKAREEVHLQGLYHRTVNIMINDKSGRLLLQRRSGLKKIQPQRWDLSCSEHLQPKESYADACKRGIAEELGIPFSSLEDLRKIRGTELVQSEYDTNGMKYINREFSEFYGVTLASSSIDLLVNQNEVSEVQLLPLNEVLQLSEKEDLVTSWFSQEIRSMNNNYLILLCKTVPQYMDDSYAFEGDGIFLYSFMLSKQCCVILNSTLFHPQGGGQPGDVGYLTCGDVKFKVEDTKWSPDKRLIFHLGSYVGEDHVFASNCTVHLSVHEESRRMNARRHSGGHLLDIAVHHVLRDLPHEPLWNPTKGSHFPTMLFVEYEGSIPANMSTTALQEKFQVEVDRLLADQSVPSVRVESTLKDTNVNRVIHLIPGEMSCPCGGTHVKHIQEIQSLRILSISLKKKIIKISYSII